jgi:hypothetical protein
VFDVLIIGGVSGISCSYNRLGEKQTFVADKKLELLPSKASSLQAVFNNAYGITPGTLGF